MPDRVSIYMNGALVLDSQLTMTDAGMVDDSQFRPTQEMIDAGPTATGMLPTRFPIEVPSASVAGLARPVIVHASVDGSGKVIEEEISSASDPALAQTALEVVKSAKFAAANTQQQMYINVRFVPESR
jgi:TonB family protein